MAGAEADALKRAFQQVDTKGGGFFARADLAKLFQELEAWSQADLDEMFDAVDTQKDGTISYDALVDWIMQEDEMPRPEIKEFSDTDSEADEKACMEDAEDIEDAHLDLSQYITSAEWVRIAMGIDVDDTEAESIYTRVLNDMREAGQDSTAGVPLLELLDDVQINPEDQEALQSLANVIGKVKAPEDDPFEEGNHTRKVALDLCVRLLDQQRKPAEEAWDVLMGSDALSAAGRVAMTARYESDRARLITKVKEAMVSPPMLPAPAGQQGNIEQCARRIQRIVEQCKADGVKFTDPEWDLTAVPQKVLYVDSEKPGYDCTVATPFAYKRLSEMVAKPVLFKGGISAGDIKQGQIGTCFLLGALGAIASNYVNAIKSIFIKYDVEVGVYGVRFCVDGEWTHILVDDIMPVDKNGRMLYARSADPEEIWCPILEKAYCKLHTCYEMCDGGKPTDAIYSFFGGVSGKFEISDSHKKEPGTYFDILRKARMRGFLMTTTYVITKDAKKGGGKCGEAILPTGLVGGHVYSIMKLVDACGVKLVQCRNPWGTGEWKGKYADANKDGEWTPELVAATGWTNVNDGTFYMCIEDFVVNSGGVEYARTFGPDWKKVTQYKRFSLGTLQATSGWAYKAKAANELSFPKNATIEVITINPGWWYGNVLQSPTVQGLFPGNYVKLDNRPVARFDIEGIPAQGSKGPISVVVLLQQPNVKMQRKFFTRKEDGLNYKDTSYPGMQLVVISQDGKVALKREGKKRVVNGEFKLPARGIWKIYALSVDGRGGEFSLRCYVKDGTVTLKEVDGASISEVQQAISAAETG